MPLWTGVWVLQPLETICVMKSFAYLDCAALYREVRFETADLAHAAAHIPGFRVLSTIAVFNYVGSE